MTIINRALPGLFGGVSQQMPAMRHATHCAQQDNGLGTLDDGLYKRPGTEHIALLDLAGPGTSSVVGSEGRAYGHVIDKGPAGMYQLVLVNGNLMLYDMATGSAQLVAFPDGLAYLNTTNPEQDFRCVTVADYTFIINRSKVVAMQAAVDSPNPNHVAYINVRTAAPNIDYTVKINGIPATVSVGSNPTNAGVASALATALSAALSGYTVTQLAGTNIVQVTKVGTPITCSVSDGWGNNALQCISNGVPRYADLPPVFTNGYTVTITGTADSVKDTYYVKWVNDRWVETKKPALDDTFNGATMPHQLRPDGSGGWIFEQADWDTRKVGDDDTAPLPSFVGSGMRDVFFFRNRLGFLAADGLVLSRSGDYFSFFPKSATQVVSTDPIDLSSTASDVEALDWAVVYNKTLLVFAANKQQFRLEGGDVLSPDTARLIPATTFESFNGARPAAIGNKVLFAATAGQHCQLNLYRVDDARISDTVDDLTAHVPRYVPKEPRQIEASTVMKAAVVVPSGPSKELYLFKYELDDNDRMTQKEWQRITLAAPEPCYIIKVYWSSRKLSVLTHRTIPGDLTAGGRFVLESLDFDTQATDAGCTISLRLDGRVRAAFVSTDGLTSVMRVPYIADGSSLVPLLCQAGLEPIRMAYEDAPVKDFSDMVTDLTLPGDLSGSVVWVGRPFTMTYEFSEVLLRDKDGAPIMDAELTLKNLLVRYKDTGWFEATVESAQRETYTYPFEGRVVGQPGQGVSMLGLSSGDFSIPVYAKAKTATIRVRSDSYLPVNLQYAEWVGDASMRSRR